MVHRRVICVGFVLAAACRPADDGRDPGDDSSSPPDRPDPEDSAVLPIDTDAPAPVVGPEVRCSDPSARPQAPYSAPITGGAWAGQRWDPRHEAMYAGGGLVIADLDGDDRLDVLLPGEDGSQLFLQTGALDFTDASDRLPDDAGLGAVGGSAADYDGDGDLDVLITRYRHAHTLWRNDGGAFVDVTDAAGMTDPLADRRTTSATWADVDLDGDLDVFIGSHGAFFQDPRPPGDGGFLYLNDGDGTFTDATDRVPQASLDGYVFAAALVDLDGDTWPDLYTVHDFGHRWPNALAWNRGGTFVPDAGASGLDVSLQGMGLDVGDLDRDGALDLIMSGWGNNRVMIGTPGGTMWFDAHQALGVDGDPARAQDIGWAMVQADLDNDGDLDIAEGFGKIFNQRGDDAQPDEIFLQDPDGYTPVGAAWGFDHPGQTRGVLAVDLDGDGWLDLARRDLIGPATLQRAACGAAAWAVVRLGQEGLNRHAIGARVRVTAGGRTHERLVVAGSTGVLSGGPPEVHVGLADAAQIDRIEVVWPDGARSGWADLPVRRVITLTR